MEEIQEVQAGSHHIELEPETIVCDPLEKMTP